MGGHGFCTDADPDSDPSSLPARCGRIVGDGIAEEPFGSALTPPVRLLGAFGVCSLPSLGDFSGLLLVSSPAVLSASFSISASLSRRSRSLAK